MKLKVLSNSEHKAIYDVLLLKSIDRKLKRGVTNMVASLFSISIRNVQRIWKQATSSAYGDISHKRTGNCGHKKNSN